MKLRIAFALLLFAAGTANAADKWTSVRSENFHLVGNASAAHIRKVARDFELFRWGFSQFFTMRGGLPSTGTTVLVFKNDLVFKPFKPLYKGKPANVAGFFLGTAEKNFIALSASEETPRVIYHEYVHRLMADRIPGMPAWFSEGFAECFGGLAVEGGGRGLRMGRAIPEHVALLKDRTFLPLEKLFAVTQNSPDYNERDKQSLFYAESWALVHYLMLGENRTLQAPLFEFLGALGTGRPAAEVFKEVFRTDLATFQRSFESYIQRRVTWPALVIPLPPDAGSGVELKSSALSEGETEFYLGDLLLQMDRPPDAERHLGNAVRLEPESGDARAAMAMLRLQQNDRAGALEFIQQAVALSPESYLIRYYHAEVIRAGGKALLLSEEETARAELIASLALEPRFTGAVEALARLNLSRNTELAETIALLVRAERVSGASSNIKLLLAHALARTNEREAARPFAIEVIRSPLANAAMKQSAAGILSFLDDGAPASPDLRAAPRDGAKPDARPLEVVWPDGARTTEEPLRTY